jgi:hypothetical protein
VTGAAPGLSRQSLYQIFHKKTAPEYKIPERSVVSICFYLKKYIQNVILSEEEDLHLTKRKDV